MKQFRIVSLVLAAVVLLGSCATFDKSKVDRVTKATVHSLLINRMIDTSDFPMLGAIISSFAQSDKMDLTPMVVKLERDMYGDYSKQLPFGLVPETELLANSTYVNEISEVKSAMSSWYLAPTGYAKSPLNKKAAIAMASAFPDSNASVSINISFRLKTKGGISVGGFSTGRAAIVATVDYLVLNNQGDVVLQKTSIQPSQKTIGVVMGAFKADALPEMCSDAADRALAEFNKWLITQKKK